MLGKPWPVCFVLLSLTTAACGEEPSPQAVSAAVKVHEQALGTQVLALTSFGIGPPGVAYSPELEQFAIVAPQLPSSADEQWRNIAIRIERTGTVVDTVPVTLPGTTEIGFEATSSGGSIRSRVVASDGMFVVGTFATYPSGHRTSCWKWSDPASTTYATHFGRTGAGRPPLLNYPMALSPDDGGTMWGTFKHLCPQGAPIGCKPTFEVGALPCGGPIDLRLSSQGGRTPSVPAWVVATQGTVSWGFELTPSGLREVNAFTSGTQATTLDIGAEAATLAKGAHGRALFFRALGNRLRLYMAPIGEDGQFGRVSSDRVPGLSLFSDRRDFSDIGAAFDGTYYLVFVRVEERSGSTYTSGIYLRRFDEDLTPVDPSWKRVLVVPQEYFEGLEAASDQSGRTLLTYAWLGSANSGVATTLGATLIDTAEPGPLPQGNACTHGLDCATGLCIDGVCCNSACGLSSTNDCQACSVAAGAQTDGTCTPLTSDHVCRDAQGVCDIAESCTGTNPSCPPDAVLPSGTSCGPLATGPCDVDDVCDGSGFACRSDTRRTNTEVCRESIAPCDAPELCDGLTDACPSDAVSALGAICRASIGDCDAPELCDGQSIACPADAFRAAGHECRPSSDLCDAPEACSGTSVTCPADELFPAETPCREPAGACDEQDVCDGQSARCKDILKPQAFECRTAVGSCDVPELCTGSNAGCPDDMLVAATKVCRALAGPCDRVEFCSGVSGVCPEDLFAPALQTCRVPSGACDVAETCDGDSALCPDDEIARAETVCAESSDGVSEPSTCNGLSKNCYFTPSEPEPATPEPPSRSSDGAGTSGCMIQSHAADSRFNLGHLTLVALLCRRMRRERRNT